MKRFFLALSLVACVACDPAPNEVLDRAHRAIESSDLEVLSQLVHDDYVDPLGGKAELLRDVRTLNERFARITITTRDLSIASGSSKVDAQVVGTIEIELHGDTTLRSIGSLDVDLRKRGGLQIRTGLLADVRDIVELADRRRRALEANDARAYAALLHPSYKDGDHDLEATKARLLHDLEGVRVRLEPSLYKLEVRGPTAHLDEHYVLSVNDRVLPPSVARFTLVRNAGLWRISAGLYPAE